MYGVFKHTNISDEHNQRVLRAAAVVDIQCSLPSLSASSGRGLLLNICNGSLLTDRGPLPLALGAETPALCCVESANR